MGHKLKPINMKDTWVPGSHRILKHKHPPGFSHWQLCLSHFLRALGSDAVGDLQNDTWPWRLEFLVWRVRIGLDWIDFWLRLSFRRKTHMNEIYRWYLDFQDRFHNCCSQGRPNHLIFSPRMTEDFAEQVREEVEVFGSDPSTWSNYW